MSIPSQEAFEEARKIVACVCCGNDPKDKSGLCSKCYREVCEIMLFERNLKLVLDAGFNLDNRPAADHELARLHKSLFSNPLPRFCSKTLRSRCSGPPTTKIRFVDLPEEFQAHLMAEGVGGSEMHCIKIGFDTPKPTQEGTIYSLIEKFKRAMEKEPQLLKILFHGEEIPESYGDEIKEQIKLYRTIIDKLDPETIKVVGQALTTL